MSFRDVIAALDRAGCDPQMSGDKGKARCPSHRGKGRSLSVALEGNRTLVKCFAKGCTFEAITAALGLRRGAFFEDDRLAAAIGGYGACRRQSSTKKARGSDMAKKGKGFDKPTLSQLAKKSGTTVKHLRSLGWTEGEGEIEKKDGSTFRVTGCRIPYFRPAEEGEKGRKLSGVQVVESFAKIRASLDGSPKYLHERPGQPGFYGEWLLEEYRQREKPVLVLVEGETDTAALTSKGLPAVGIPGVDTVAKVLRADHLEGFKRLFIIREPGEGGETFCKNLAAHLPAIGWRKSTTVVDLGHDDSAEMLCELKAGFLAAFKQACRVGVSLNEIAAQGEAESLIKWAHQVKIRPVRYVLYPYIPIGKLTLLAGEAGIGKSTGIVAVSSAITRGQLVGGSNPERSELGSGRVLVFTGGEDGAEETTVPRFLASGGDPEKFAVVDAKGLSFADIDKIREITRQVMPSVTIFDPLLKFWPEGVTQNDQDAVGPILNRLCGMAEEFSMGLMAVLWAPKGEVKKAMNMFFGSVAFQGTMRSGLVVQPHPHDDPRHGVRRGIFSHAKVNNAPLGRSFGYEIDAQDSPILTERAAKMLPEEIEALRRVGSFRWLDVMDETADEITKRAADGSAKGMAYVKAKILECLKGKGEVPVAALNAVAAENKLPFNLFFAAKLDLGVRDRLEESSGERLVWLPGEEAEEEDELEQMTF